MPELLLFEEAQLREDTMLEIAQTLPPRSASQGVETGRRWARSRGWGGPHDELVDHVTKLRSSLRGVGSSEL